MKPPKPKKPNQPPARTVKKAEPAKDGGSVTKVLFNFLGVIVSVMIIYILFNSVQGYDWLYNTMLKGNLETIAKYPDLTIQQRYEAKWGSEIAYVNQIKNKTPDSAIILIPPRKLLTQVGFKSWQDIPWLTYFLYPRQIIYDDDKDSSSIYKQANYLVAINGWGIEKLNYRPEKPEGFMILPLKR